jgi:serine phosphatase RsbU (regulator of sigma subunit)
VRDLNSRNGVKLGGVAVRESLIREGDRMRIGEFDVVLRDVRRPATGAGPNEPRTGSTLGRVPLEDAQSTDVRSINELGSQAVSAEHLSALLDLGQALLAEDDEAARLTVLCAHLVREPISCASAMLLRVAVDADGEPIAGEAEVLARDSDAGAGVNLSYISRTTLRRACVDNAPVLASNAGDRQIDINISLDLSRAAIAAIACPIHRRPGSVDLLYVTLNPEQAGEALLGLMRLVARQLEQSSSLIRARQYAEEQARIRADLEQAQAIQQRLLPRELPERNVQLAIGFEPSRWVGGDYVDAVELPDGRDLLVIADVVGKGLPAAMIAALLHAMIHAGVRGAEAADRPYELAASITALNRYLLAFLPEGAFVTLAALTLDGESGEMRYVNAGHPPPIVATAAGGSRFLAAGLHTPLGVLEQPYTETTQTLERGDWLVLFTDGVTEMPGRESKMLGLDGTRAVVERVNAAFNASDDVAADALANRLTAELDDILSGRLAGDDRTFLLARRADER